MFKWIQNYWPFAKKSSLSNIEKMAAYSAKKYKSVYLSLEQYDKGDKPLPKDVVESKTVQDFVQRFRKSEDC